MKPLRLEMTPTRSRRLNEVLGLGLLAVAVLLLLSLVSYTPTDPSWNAGGGFAGTGPPRPPSSPATRLSAESSRLSPIRKT